MTTADHYHVTRKGAELIVELDAEGNVFDPATFGTFDDAQSYVNDCASFGDVVDLHACNDPRCAGCDPATGLPTHPEALGYTGRTLRPDATLL